MDVWDGRVLLREIVFASSVKLPPFIRRWMVLGLNLAIASGRRPSIEITTTWLLTKPVRVFTESTRVVSDASASDGRLSSATKRGARTRRTSGAVIGRSRREKRFAGSLAGGSAAIRPVVRRSVCQMEPLTA